MMLTTISQAKGSVILRLPLAKLDDIVCQSIGVD